MKAATTRPLVVALLLAAALAAASLAAGCRRLSEEVRDPSVGRNGGFEHARGGLPVNWLVYSPRTVPGASFTLALDEDEHPEGERSLFFDVASCSSDGGWRSPGIAQEVPAEPGATYRVRFRVRSEGCAWSVRTGAVSAKRGALETVEGTELADGAWHEVSRELTIPPGLERLRFELSVLSPGRLWVDDVRVERVATSGTGG